jgi:hypothetical protein
MGRWDDDRFSGFGSKRGGGRARRIPGKWTRIRIAKLAISVLTDNAVNTISAIDRMLA